MSKSYQSFNNIFSQSSMELAQLSSKLRELDSINQSIHQILAKEFKPHCLAAKLEQNRLTLAVDSSAWASKLRFQSSDLLKALRQTPRYANVQSIRIIVSLQMIESLPNKSWQAKPISSENSRLINETANSIQDPTLKKALKKLALRKGGLK